MMHIVHLAAEYAPFARVGGLGEMVAGLAEEMAKKNPNISIFLPKYDCLALENISLTPLLEFSFPYLGKERKSALFTASYKNVHLYFIEPKNLPFFQDNAIYAGKTDPLRFLYFTVACLEALVHMKKRCDILHFHDWHTAVGPCLQKEVYAKKGLSPKKTLLTIHNLDYQGKALKKVLYESIPSLKTPEIEKAFEDPFSKREINLLKGGIIYADCLTTVSSTYSKEILTKQRGCGLDFLLKKQKKKLFGIVNGIDTTIWNPALDPHLESSYSSKDPVEKILAAKRDHKDLLQRKFFLQKTNAPLVASIGRLVPQKGIELIEEALFTSLELGAQFALLGSSPIDKIQRHFSSVQKNLLKNPNVFLEFTFNNPLSHLIFSAADFLVVPSFYEPCGLTQMIALRYGTIPIVFHTGGLADTICDIKEVSPKQKNGFSFKTFSKKALRSTLKRALDWHKNSPDEVATLICEGMKSDFSWKKPSENYLSLYKKSIS